MSDDAPTYTARVLRHLTARPGEWVSADVLATIGGRCAWRTRVSDARAALERDGRGTIENRLTRPRDDDGNVLCVRSWYRFVPRELEQDARIHFTPPVGMPVYTTAQAATPPRPSRTTGDPDAGRLF